MLQDTQKNGKALDKLLDYLWQASPHNKDKIKIKVRNKIIEIYDNRTKEKN